MLVPALAPGDTVVMDNLAAHKVAGVRQAIEAVARTCATFQPTVQTSTRSNKPSPS